MSRIPHIAILGRPNVGKSTLFNRLIGRRQAIVDAIPGITRDRLEGEFEWDGAKYLVSDLAGWDENPENPFSSEIIAQINSIAKTADVLLILVDANDGLTEWDRMVVERIRSSPKPVILVVNKCDTVPAFEKANEFYELGLGEPFPISATHNLNVTELIDRIGELVGKGDTEIAFDDEEPDAIRIAIIGRQNVGKSTLFNTLVGDHRAIVSDIPGTTRDAVDTAIEIDGERYIFIDTAGLKKHSRVTESVDYYASIRTESALVRSDVALLLIDVADGVLDTDKKVAGIVEKANRACIIIGNKWDLSEDASGHRAIFEKHIRKKLHFLSHAPLCFTSGLYNQGVKDIFPLIKSVHAQFNRVIPTSVWNKAMEDALQFRPPPTVKGKLLRMNYITQTGSAPPTLSIFANHPEYLRPSYKRYLENYFRRQFGFEGSPLVMNIRRKNWDIHIFCFSNVKSHLSSILCFK